MSKKANVLAVLFGGWLLVIASANADKPSTVAEVERNREHKRLQEKRLRVLRKVYVSAGLRLVAELDLDEAKAMGVLRIFNRNADVFVKEMLRGRALRQKLGRKFDRSGGVTEEIVKDLDELDEHERNMAELERSTMRDLRKVLSPQEAARTAELLPKIKRQIRARIRRGMVDKAGRSKFHGRERQRRAWDIDSR